jgi:hypothetical protein
MQWLGILVEGLLLHGEEVAVFAEVHAEDNTTPWFISTVGDSKAWAGALKI